MGKVEEAKIGELKVEEDQDALEELLAKVKIPDGQEYRIIDAMLDQEIVGKMRTHYRPQLVYNIPFKSDKGSVSCRECDLIEGGCWYKKNNVKHTHVIDVGYEGAKTAMRSYGMLRAYVEDRPEVVEEAGVLYWAAYAEVTDGHNANSIGRWYLQPVMMKAGKGFRENEHACAIAQSKALRNCILALIPHDLIEQWKEDYRSGKKPFDPGRTKEMGYDKQTASPQPKRRPRPKAQNQPQEQSGELDNLMGELAVKRGLNAEIVSAWIELKEGTVAKNKLFLHRITNDDAQWADAEADYRKFETEFLEAQRKAEGTEDYMQEGE